MFVATAVLSSLLALVFLGAGSSKVAKVKMQRDNAEHLGFSIGAYQRIGALQIAGAIGLAVGLWVVPLGVAAALGLTLMMIGAITCHVRAKDKPAMFAPALVLAVLAALALSLRLVTA